MLPVSQRCHTGYVRVVRGKSPGVWGEAEWNTRRSHATWFIMGNRMTQSRAARLGRQLRTTRHDVIVLAHRHRRYRRIYRLWRLSKFDCFVVAMRRRLKWSDRRQSMIRHVEGCRRRPYEWHIVAKQNIGPYYLSFFRFIIKRAIAITTRSSLIRRHYISRCFPISKLPHNIMCGVMLL